MTQRDKDETLRRHLRGASRHERRKLNEARNSLHKEGHRPQFEEEDGWNDDDSRRKRVKRGSGARPKTGTLTGTVSGLQRGRVLIRAADQEWSIPLSRQRLADTPTVGDEVELTLRPGGPPRIEALRERRSVLLRPAPGSHQQEKRIAANVDVGVIVAAALDPPLRPALIDRFVIALERGGITPLLCISKLDLAPAGALRDKLELELNPYAELGLELFRVCATHGTGIDELHRRLSGLTVVLVGHSGVGKSSILNALASTTVAKEGSVREHDGRGCHTTTNSSLHELQDGLRVIDTPGVREFGLWKMNSAELRGAFPGFAALGPCRFANCGHRDEPGCAVQTAVEEKRFSRSRYAIYLRLLGSLDEP